MNYKRSISHLLLLILMILDGANVGLVFFFFIYHTDIFTHFIPQLSKSLILYIKIFFHCWQKANSVFSVVLTKQKQNGKTAKKRQVEFDEYTSIVLWKVCSIPICCSQQGYVEWICVLQSVSGDTSANHLTFNRQQFFH